MVRTVGTPGTMTAVAELILENEVDRVAMLNLLSIDVFKMQQGRRRGH